jgi:hypothetical protein
LLYKINKIGDVDMKKYEYKCVSILGDGERTTRILNEYGQQGWELVCTCWIWHYFKREI